MQTITENDARKRFTALLNEIERGEVITITRMGSPVARLVPIRQAENTQEDGKFELLKVELERKRAEWKREDIQKAVEGLRMLGGELRLDGLTIRDLIDDGRR